MVELAGWVAAVVLILLGLVALGRLNANRTWTDEEYDRERRSGTAIGNAMLATQAIFQPGAQYVLEQRTAEEAEDVDAGGPPDPGTGLQ